MVSGSCGSAEDRESLRERRFGMVLRKERSQTERKGKAQGGPCRILERINENAYKVELPEEYGAPGTFNVAERS